MVVVPSSRGFDALEVPLQGTVLVEAAAGAGKTHALTSVYLRLLLEQQLPVEQILVVTFSEAAGAELRLRLRERLAVELACCEQGDAAAAEEADEEAVCLRTGLWRRAGGVERAARLLWLALHAFDEAGICTIHALCRRVLSDYAPLHDLPGRIEILPERDTPLLEEATDLWRREFYDGPVLYASWAAAEGCDPEWLARGVETWAGRPDLRWEPAEAPELEPLEQSCRGHYAALRVAWKRNQEPARDFLLDGPELKRNLFRKDKTRKLLGKLQGWLEADAMTWPAGDLLQFLERLGPEALSSACKKHHQPLRHPLFDACPPLLDGLRNFAEACARRRVALQKKLLVQAAGPLWESKRRLGHYTFQDLLNRLLAALRAPGGERLAAALRARYRAALVDEFQDTDQVQHEILQRIFQHSEAGLWFMVGDPKQSIYGFRGADLRVFLEARAAADACFHLAHNWRAAPRLVQAVNALFGAVEHPFLLPEIDFRPAVPAPAAAPPCLEVEGDGEAPFRIWLDSPPGGRELAAARRRRVAAAVAAEAVRLLRLGDSGHAWLREGERRSPLRGADVAFLVHTHEESRELRACLRELGVAAVVYGRDSVYRTREAEELWLLLWAVYTPERESCVRAALATELLGRNAPELYGLGRDEAAWSKLLERFRAWRKLWQSQGFIAMFRQLLRDEGLPRRLLRLPSGGRRLADLLQLGELLHEYESAAHAGMGALLRRLDSCRQAAAQKLGIPGEDEERRLESDEKLLRIFTMHRAKGLEFPVVFCPFLQPSKPRSKTKEELWLEHRPPDCEHAALNFESEPEEARQKRAAEEHMRLSYVTLTRARCRCYMVWAPQRAAGVPTGEALARLLPPQRESDQEAGQDYAWLERASDGAIQVGQLPAGEARPWSAASDRRRLQARVPVRAPPEPGIRVASYSLLVQSRDAHHPDYDWSAREKGKSPEQDASFPTAFPAGERAGHCLHELLERTDFEDPAPGEEAAKGLRTLAAEVLRHHGFIGPKNREDEQGARRIAWACELRRRVLTTRLEEQGALCLGGIPRTRRLDEMGFDFRAAGLSPELLRGLGARHAERLPESLRRQVQNLKFSTVRACVTGRIDLVFESEGRYHLVDYKSHLLGADPADYVPGRLDAVMRQDGYGLQYLFYTLALHRYLRWRLPDYQYERHFGAIYYLFLRGMEPARAASGVWRTRLPEAFIEELDAAMGREPPSPKGEAAIGNSRQDSPPGGAR